MADATRLLVAASAGDPQAAAELLPLVYDELRKLATARMAKESPGHTLNATALVHEAYVRLVGPNAANDWNGRGHFFAAAAEAMRRILIDHARSRQRLKRGGGGEHQELQDDCLIADERVDEMIAVHEALDALEQHDSLAASLVKLRFFAGFEHGEAAKILGLSRGAADRLWLLARTWLFRTIGSEEK